MQVVVFDKLDYCATLNNLAPVLGSKNFKFIKGDIRSLDLLSYVLTNESIDCVMHFAAQTHVDNSFGNSLDFTINNIYGTHVLLEACRKYSKLTRFINVSTDEVYGERSFHEAVHLDEEAVLEPTNPYSAAKAGAEMMAKAYHTSYNLPVITTRGNNVYGPHQFPEKIIPKFTSLAARGEALPVHGDGKASRSYLYVEDVAEAYLYVLHKGVVGDTYNIGSQRERTAQEVAEDISKIFDLGQDKIIHVRDRAFQDRRYLVDDSKLQQLGWKEETSWEVGLKKTIEWVMQTDSMVYWEHGDVESALLAHPLASQMNFDHYNGN